MNPTKENEVPQFKTLEEEREYWEARGPLVKGKKGRVNRPRPGLRRNSFLAVRLTGEELTRLRDLAAREGLGPSTYTRRVLLAAIERAGSEPAGRTLEEALQLADKSKFEEAGRLFASALLSLSGIEATPRKTKTPREARSKVPA